MSPDRTHHSKPAPRGDDLSHDCNRVDRVRTEPVSWHRDPPISRRPRRTAAWHSAIGFAVMPKATLMRVHNSSVGARHEHRLPVLSAVVVALVLYLLISVKVQILPVWVVPTIGILLLIPLVILNPRRLSRDTTWSRRLSIVLATFLTVKWGERRQLTAPHAVASSSGRADGTGVGELEKTGSGAVFRCFLRAGRVGSGSC